MQSYLTFLQVNLGRFAVVRYKEGGIIHQKSVRTNNHIYLDALMGTQEYSACKTAWHLGGRWGVESKQILGEIHEHSQLAGRP